MTQLAFEAATEADTDRLGAALAEALPDRVTVGLIGTLGAGKTRLVRAIAAACGVDRRDVTSPTFVLLTTYPGRLSLHHADLYRLGGDDDRELGLEELPGTRGVLAIEWAERLSWRPWASTISVSLEHDGNDRRRVRVERVSC